MVSSQLAHQPTSAGPIPADITLHFITQHSVCLSCPVLVSVYSQLEGWLAHVAV